MIPVRPRYSRIEQLTNSLLADSKINTAPVPIEDIVKKQGIRIQSLDLKDVSGLVVRHENQVVIGVNKDHAPTRRRFTIAHELAHAMLHEGKEVRYDRDFRVDFRSGVSALGVDVEEMEANFFAACILMPRHLLETEALLADLDHEDAADAVKALATRYKVSPHAMSIRIGNLSSRGAAATRLQRL